MKRMVFVIFLWVCSAAVKNACAQSGSAVTKQRFAILGNFRLENGQEIKDCKIGYRSFGKLNASRSNTVIYLTGGGGTSEMYEAVMGADVDTSVFYLLLIDALGNGVSSSPSNSAMQAKTLFPRFSIRDMVNSQYQLLREHLHIHHVVAVVGGSMGGLQALEWAVSYPGFMDKVVAIEATPKLSSYEMLWMNTYIEAVVNDTAYRGGNYTSTPVLPQSEHLFQLMVTSPSFVNNTVPEESFANWFSTFETNAVDCNDYLSQIRAILKHDISSAYGTLETAAKRIRAKLLLINNKQDRIITADLSIKFAAMVGAKLIVMDSELGHLVFNEKIPIEATRAFLSNQ